MFASIRNVNPIWREFGDLQNLCGPQTFFIWDLDIILLFLPYLFISTVSTDKDSDSLGPQIYSFFWHFGICFEVLLQTTTIKCPVLFSNITLSKISLRKVSCVCQFFFSLHTSDKGKINRKKVYTNNYCNDNIRSG